MIEASTARGRQERPINILLVEDNPADVRLTKEALAEGSILNRLFAVADGEEAMGFLRRHGKYARAARPDLILLDLNMPKKDGRQTLHEIKADPGFRRIPVVVLTTMRGGGIFRSSSSPPTARRRPCGKLASFTPARFSPSRSPLPGC